MLVRVNRQERIDNFLDFFFDTFVLPYLKGGESEFITGMSDNKLELLDQKPFCIW